MSTALRIAHGAFGRVALLDMDWSLVRHAHPHCHVLLKVEGADTQFVVGDKVYPLTDLTAVLVNGWQPHSYVHDPERPRTVILALYIEPEWLKAFRPGWAASGAPGFFSHPSGDVSPRIRGLAMNLAADMMARPEARGSHEVDAVRFDDRGDRALHAVAKFSGFDPGNERRSGDWRIRRSQPRCGPKPGASRSIPLRRKRVVAVAFLPVVRILDRRAAEGLPERRAHGAGGRRGAQSDPQACATSAERSASPSRPFHALLPQSCRCQPARVPKRLPSRELMLHCTPRK
jgi:hypothetical protein